MCEAWEDILMEMDSKLMKFADEKQKVCGYFLYYYILSKKFTFFNPQVNVLTLII